MGGIFLNIVVYNPADKGVCMKSQWFFLTESSPEAAKVPQVAIFTIKLDDGSTCELRIRLLSARKLSSCTNFSGEILTLEPGHPLVSDILGMTKIVGMFYPELEGKRQLHIWVP